MSSDPAPFPADPTVLHPMPGQPRVVQLKPLVTSELIEVGDYAYYDDPEHATEFETRNVLYHYGPERLVIGKFCALATGVRFIMNGSNHRMDGPSTFPFPTLGGSWTDHFDLLTNLPNRGDTVVGNDVWIGYEAVIMPGVRIGHGAIISARSVVVSDVPDYGIVGGNPARLIRTRYEEEDIARLLAVAWWDWPAEHLTRHVRTVMSGTVAELEAVAPGVRRGTAGQSRLREPGDVLIEGLDADCRPEFIHALGLLTGPRNRCPVLHTGDLRAADLLTALIDQRAVAQKGQFAWVGRARRHRLPHYRWSRSRFAATWPPVPSPRARTSTITPARIPGP